MATNQIMPVDTLAGCNLLDVNTPYGPAIGTSTIGTDGHIYTRAKASAAITASTVCILTENANPLLNTAAVGAGAWTSPATALALNDIAWFKKTAI
jgi:hypothetical protein